MQPLPGTHTVTRSRALFFFVYLLMFLYGIQATVLGVVLPELIDHYATTTGAGGFLATAQTVGGFIILIVVVLASKKVSRKNYMALSYAIIGCSSIGVAFSPGYFAVAVIFIALGAGMRLFDASSNSFVGEHATTRRNRSMNLLHTCFAAGAIIGPAVAQLILNRTGTWSTVYLATGVLSLSSGVLMAVLRTRDPETRTATAQEGHVPQPAFFRLFTDPTLMFISLTLALYAVHQSSLTAWLPLFLESTGKFSSESGIGISAYWIGILIGRIAATKIPDSVDRMLVISLGAILGAAVTTLVLVTGSGRSVVLGLLLVAGATSGALIPLSLSSGQARYPERTTSITALFSIFLLGGRFVGPWGIGAIADTTGMRSALYVTAIVLVCCSLTAYLAREKKRSNMEETHGS